MDERANANGLAPDALLDRRGVLRLLGGLGLGAVAVACGGSSRSTSKATSTTAGAATCVLMPELTEGPFYLDVEKIRSDITEGKPGTPLALAISVVDATTCAPIKDAAVDIWHTDASGAYSGVSGPGQAATTGATFLRGIQMTDAQGLSQFTTIYPGWYRGRAVHIHVKVHLGGAGGGAGVHTGQLFFPDDVNAAAFRASPYASRGNPDVTNANDSIYRQSNGASTLAVQSQGTGYAGSITLGIKRS